jgi:aspartate kinase
VSTPSFDTVVMKFGGSSVADPEKVRHVGRRFVEARRRGLNVVGTVSAMGKTTDSLIALAREVSPAPNPRELDMLLSTGERIACALVAMAIHDLGEDAVSYTGSQAGILTDSAHTRAKIREIRGDRIRSSLAEGKIVLVAGFQGFSRDTMEITTLGRGAGDLTAVALAATLGAACEIHSDVAGVFTADPRIVPGARKIPVVSYDEMLEMAASGAKVLALRSVELARNHGVRIHARSTFSDEEGTWVQDVQGMEQPMVTAVTHSETDVVFTLTGIPDRPGVAAMIFDAVAQGHVNVDTIIQNVVHGHAEMSFSVPA